MQYQTRYEGSASIEDLDRTIEDTQGARVVKLVTLKGLVVQGKKYNYATYQYEDSLEDVPDEMIFVEITDPGRIPSIKADHLTDVEVFDEKIFVEDVEKRYLCFARFDD